MNKHFFAAALVVASFSALADGAEYQYPQVMSSSLSRAEVRAELARAAAAGELLAGEQSYVAPVAGQPLSRNEVRAELETALGANSLARGEFSYGVEPAAFVTIASH